MVHARQRDRIKTILRPLPTLQRAPGTLRHLPLPHGTLGMRPRTSTAPGKVRRSVLWQGLPCRRRQAGPVTKAEGVPHRCPQWRADQRAGGAQRRSPFGQMSLQMSFVPRSSPSGLSAPRWRGGSCRLGRSDRGAAGKCRLGKGNERRRCGGDNGWCLHGLLLRLPDRSWTCRAAGFVP